MPITDVWTPPAALDLAIDDLYTETVHDGMVSDLLWLYNTLFSPSGRAQVPGRLDETALVATATTIAFPTIIPTHRSLRLVLSVRGAAAAGTTHLWLRVNADAGSNYVYAYETLQTGETSQPNNPQTVIDLGVIPAATYAAGKFMTMDLEIVDYRGTASHKIVRGSRLTDWSSGGGVTPTAELGACWRSTAAVARLDLLTSDGAGFVAGSVATLYGLP